MSTIHRSRTPCMSKPILLLVLAFPLPLSAQVRSELDLRYAGDAAVRIAHDSGYRRNTIVTFLGDIDGDGRDDFVYHYHEEDENGWPASNELRILFGTEEALNQVPASQLRQLRLHLAVTPDLDDRSYGPAGDVDRDGYADFLVALPGIDEWAGRIDPGLVILLFGGPALPLEVSVDDLLKDPDSIAGLRSIRFVGAEGIHAGWETFEVGDLNGDGIDELAITARQGVGARNGGDLAGTVWVLYGGFSLEGDIDLATAVGDEVSGFTMRGAYGRTVSRSSMDYLGRAPRGVGDVNGDGYGDFVVTAEGASRDNTGESGLVYLVFGGPDLPREILPESGETDAELYVAFYSPWSGRERFGNALASAGDVDGDGLDDFLIGAPGASETFHQTGRVYLIYGSRDWEPVYDSASYASLRHFVLEGALPLFRSPNGLLGYSLAGTGDWNNDGFDDFLVGAPNQVRRLDGHRTGRAYLIYGTPDLPPSALDEEVGLRIDGLVIHGEDAQLRLTDGLDAGGDFNGDGRNDIIISSRFSNPRWPGESYLYVLPGGSGELLLSLHTIEPDFGPLDGGQQVVLWGTGFSGAEEVLFGGIPASSVEAVSSARILATVPAGAQLGPVDVEISRDGGVSRIEHGFTYRGALHFSNLELDHEVLANGKSGCIVIRALPRRSSTLTRASHLEFGDINGDGLEDLVFGSPAGGEFLQGAVEIILGSRTPPPVVEERPMEDLRIVIDGDLAGEQDFGRWVSVPGDLNGDGFADIIAQSSVDSSVYRIYVIFGREEWMPSQNVFSEVAGGRAVVRTFFGRAVYARHGDDLNQDGLADFLVSSDSRNLAATVYYGDRSGELLDELLEPVGRLEYTEFPGFFGYNVCGLGDFNGDRWPDIIAGPKVNEVSRDERDEVLIILGGPEGFESLVMVPELIADRRVVTVHNEYEESLARAGIHVDSAGDFNGDGFADALIVDMYGGKDFEGMVYVLLGGSNYGAGIDEVDLRNRGTRSVAIRAACAYDQVYWAASVGDVNGDGFSDIGVPAPLWHGQKCPGSRAYVVLGDPEPPGAIPLSELFGYRGFAVAVDVEDTSATSMAGGDFNGDGLSDVAIDLGSEFERHIVVILSEGQTKRFRRGDSNVDGSLDITDALVILGHLFLGDPRALLCEKSADTDDTGALDVTDSIQLLRHLFFGAELPRPAGSCGSDPSADTLRCVRFPPCE